ncbi:MAG: LCP family protein [Actinomycetota bacterium]
MTSTEAAPPDESVLEEWDGDIVSSRRRFRRRAPAPKANPFWRFLFPLIVIGLAYLAFDLWREGTKAVLDSTDGTVVEIPSDPNSPGYEAFVTPTPTMLVLHTDDADRLVGVTVMARTLLDNGGQLILLSSELAADGRGGETLADRYASGGLTAVEESVGTLFGFGFLETATYNTRDFGLLLALVEPLPFALLDDLVQVDADGTPDVYLSAGNKQLDGSVAAEVYAFRNPDEADANRNERQLALWETWLLAITRADDINTAVPPFDEGLSPYLRAFAVGQRDIQLAPAAPVIEEDGGSVYAFDDAALAWITETSIRMTPLPTAPLGSDLSTVRLLDGTGDRRIAQAAVGALARLGEITIVGNALEFGVTETTVSYHEQSAADAAEALATEIGGVARFDPRIDEPVDLTVVIGTDWEAP